MIRLRTVFAALAAACLTACVPKYQEPSDWKIECPGMEPFTLHWKGPIDGYTDREGHIVFIPNTCKRTRIKLE